MAVTSLNAPPSLLQIPWVVAGTLRDNIVFGGAWDAKWYQKVRVLFHGCCYFLLKEAVACTHKHTVGIQAFGRPVKEEICRNAGEQQQQLSVPYFDNSLADHLSAFVW